MRFTVTAVWLAYTPLALSAINQPCARSKGAEADIRVHGRLMVYNGGYPNLRLWQVGSHHLFGIYGDTRDRNCAKGTACLGGEDWTELPSDVEKAFDGVDAFHVTLFGDFNLRPLDHLRAGSMQAACILSAEHLVRSVD